MHLDVADGLPPVPFHSPPPAVVYRPATLRRAACYRQGRKASSSNAFPSLREGHPGAKSRLWAFSLPFPTFVAVRAVSGPRNPFPASPLSSFRLIPW